MPVSSGAVLAVNLASSAHGKHKRHQVLTGFAEARRNPMRKQNSCAGWVAAMADVNSRCTTFDREVDVATN